MTNNKAVQRFSIYCDCESMFLSEDQKSKLLNRLNNLREDYFSDNIDFDTFRKTCFHLILKK